jgi:hypothetical protein
VQIVIHAVYKAGELSVYVDGVGTVSNDFDPFTPDELRVGANLAGTVFSGGTFKLLSIYGAAMTPAQVAADYADLAKVMASGVSPSPIPYLWTPRGDGRFDNARDDAGSTGAPHYNYGWIAGVGGSVPAAMLLRGYQRAGQSFTNVSKIYLSLCDFDDRFDVLNVFTDGDDGATADANSWAGEYEASSSANKVVQLTRELYNQLSGKRAVVLARMADAAGSARTIYINAKAQIGLDPISGAAKPYSVTGLGFRLLQTPSITVPSVTKSLGQIDPALLTGDIYSLGIAANPATDYNFDALIVLVGSVTTLQATTATTLYRGFLVYEDEATIIQTDFGGPGMGGRAVRRGDILRPHPHRQNLLMTMMGDETVNPTIARYWDAEQLEITPRWSVQ